MKQRVPRRIWSAPGLTGRRPRLLVEDSRPALAISDFSLFQDAGFDVAFCSGPGSDPRGCPLLRGQQCALVAGADVVLHGLDPGLGIAAAIRRYRPELPVVVEQRRQQPGTADPVPAGCVPLGYPCSVSGQIDALLRAEAAARHAVLLILCTAGARSGHEQAAGADVDQHDASRPCPDRVRGQGRGRPGGPDRRGVHQIPVGQLESASRLAGCPVDEEFRPSGIPPAGAGQGISPVTRRLRP
jgi:hypothetical protein